MIKVIELLAFPGSVCRPGTKLRGFRGVTIHDTANTSPTATAKAHADLLRGAWKNVDTSWHYAVDENEAYRSIPEDEVAWHAGDGSQGIGNNETVAIETCVNSGADYKKTLVNAAELAADILFRHGIRQASAHLFQHYDWTRKDCPHVIRSKYLWDSFKADVQGNLDLLWLPVEPNSDVYTIKPGDTFWAISRKLNIPLSMLLEINPGVDPYNLHVGQVINIVEEDGFVEHKIVSGDTFWGLSQQYETTVAEIMELNPGVDPYRLNIGQVVRIPK